MPSCNRDPQRDHNFDNHPYEQVSGNETAAADYHGATCTRQFTLTLGQAVWQSYTFDANSLHSGLFKSSSCSFCIQTLRVTCTCRRKLGTSRRCKACASRPVSTPRREEPEPPSLRRYVPLRQLLYRRSRSLLLKLVTLAGRGSQDINANLLTTMDGTTACPL